MTQTTRAFDAAAKASADETPTDCRGTVTQAPGVLVDTDVWAVVPFDLARLRD
ncbi:MAG: hypothetical protein R8G34_17075 [Paracoccaceae bacterium]|nr:hypothetical protein [Paracoccaceae bacterium]